MLTSIIKLWKKYYWDIRDRESGILYPQEPPVREKQYLTSTHWGSFFTDTHPQADHNTVSADNRHQMNTLWGYLVRKYADLAVPQLDNIVGV